MVDFDVCACIPLHDREKLTPLRRSREPIANLSGWRSLGCYSRGPVVVLRSGTPSFSVDYYLVTELICSVVHGPNVVAKICQHEDQTLVAWIHHEVHGGALTAVRDQHRFCKFLVEDIHVPHSMKFKLPTILRDSFHSIQPEAVKMRIANLREFSRYFRQSGETVRVFIAYVLHTFAYVLPHHIEFAKFLYLVLYCEG